MPGSHSSVGPKTSLSDMPSNDYHRLPVTDKQLRFARQIAARSALDLPPEVQQDRRAMSAWTTRTGQNRTEHRRSRVTRRPDRWRLPSASPG